MSNTSTYPPRLPVSIKTAKFFAERKKRADLEAFKALLSRQGGETPKNGDEPT